MSLFPFSNPLSCGVVLFFLRLQNIHTNINYAVQLLATCALIDSSFLVLNYYKIY